MEETVAKAAAGLGNDPSIAYLQARAAASRHDWTSARQTLQAVEGKLAGRDDAGLLYAQALFELGQREQALSRVQPILDRQPGNLVARRLLARIQLASGNARDAVETMRTLASQPNAEIGDLRLLAQAAAKAGDPDAGHFAERAKFPNPQALVRMLADADTAMKAHNWGNAIMLYQQILAVTNGRNAMVLNNMAYAQGQVGNTKVALDYALRALREAPGNASVMDTAGWLLATTGSNRAQALELLHKASDLAPGNSTIREHLREAEAR
jgi:predicted Zn-dependent protease